MWLNPATGEKALLDSVIIGGFIIVGLAVLSRRSGEAKVLVSPALLVFVGYCGLSVLWSEAGIYHAGKQYLKLVGMVIMAAIIALESDQVAALTKVFRRAAYVLVPVSFLFIKYYPDLGRTYNVWSGLPNYIGVAGDKNMLGQLCMLIVLVLALSCLMRLRQDLNAERRASEMWLDATLVVLTGHLLITYTDSVTSIISLGVACGTFMLLGIEWVRRNTGRWLLSAGVTVAVAQALFGFSAVVAEAFGRDPTLTNRTLIWEEVVRYASSPWIGTGFDGFWTTGRRLLIHESFAAGSAHNGYLEIYLTLGTLGLVSFSGVLVSMYRKSRSALRHGDPFGRVSVAIFVAIVLYNVTESGWRGLSLVLFLSLLLAVQRFQVGAGGDGLAK